MSQWDQFAIAEQPRKAKYSTKGPKGEPVTFEAPEGLSDAQIRAEASRVTGSKLYRGSQVRRSAAPPAQSAPDSFDQFALADDGSGLSPEVAQHKAALDKIGGQAGAQDLLMQGASFGLTDELAGVTTGVTKALGGDFDFHKNYELGRDTQEARLDDARERLGWGGTALELGGGFLTGGAVAQGGSRVATGLAARMGAGAKAGAVAGGVGGFGYGRDTDGSLVGAGLGAVGGGVLGAAMPAGGQFIRNRVSGMSRLIGSDPNLPREIVANALTADGLGASNAGALLDAARSRGSPMAISDVGENVRGLLGSVTRQPGPARQIGRGAVNARQMSQEERISASVRENLGPTANIRDQADAYIQQARAASAPLYEEAYNAPGAGGISEKIAPLLGRPSLKNALKNARSLAEEEGVDPTALGFDLTDEGEVTLTRTPSWKTLDYMKRGLDDVVEKARDPVTGKLVMTNATRATNSTLRSLLQIMDKANPAYQSARAAYAGPAKLRDALEKGAKALRRSPDDLSAEIGALSPHEREVYAMGLRKAITDQLASRTDGADKVGVLIGTPAKRAALSRAFGGRAQFDRFIATLQDERAMNETYREVSSGSQTAGRQTFDAMTNDGGLVDEAVGGALRSYRSNGISGLIGHGLTLLRDAQRFGAGQAGENAREGIAALLTEADPGVLRELLLAGQEAQIRRAAGATRAAGRAVGQAIPAGNYLGSLVGASQQPAR